jgi:hypothetical protein
LHYSQGGSTIGLVTASLSTFSTLAGWAGAGCMLLAHALLSTNRIPAGPVFQILNAGGACGLLVNGATSRAWPSAALNLAWLLISLTALAQQRKRSQAVPPVAAAALTRRIRRLRTAGDLRYGRPGA